MKKILLILVFVVLNKVTFGQCGVAFNASNWATYTTGTIVTYLGNAYIGNTAGPNGGYATAPPGGVWDAHTCGTPPTLTTTAESSIEETTAASGGNISDEGSSAVIERGVCWSTSSGPTVSDSKSSDGTGTGSFTSTLTGLTANTKYYFRAYATNSEETGYGSERWFYTGTEADMTTLTAIDIHCESFTTGITSISFGRDSRAYGGTDALGDLFTAATEFGVIYGTSESDVNSSSPGSLVGSTLQETHLADDASSLNQTDRYLEITSLSANTTYYYKAYTTTGLNTGYGTTKSFTTTTACPVFYSCAWDASVANRWSSNSDCSTADGASVTNNSILYHRHDWLSSAISDLDADVATEAGSRAMTAMPYRLVLQAGARVVANNPTYSGGFQLDVGSDAQYSNNGSLTFQVNGVGGAEGHIARLNNNLGSILVRGSYDNRIALTGSGEFCKTGTFTNLTTIPSNLNGDKSNPPSMPDTRYVNGGCVGTETLPIELIDFTVSKSDDKLIYKWITGMELNNDYFQLETSYDGISWTPLARVDGAGNSNDVLYYYHSSEAYDYIKFVRLKQVDFDGTFAYSSIKLVDTNADVSVFPNQNGFSISSSESEKVKVFSIGGSLITELQTPKGYHEISLKHLSAGTYLVIVGGQSFKIYIH